MTCQNNIPRPFRFSASRFRVLVVVFLFTAGTPFAGAQQSILYKNLITGPPKEIYGQNLRYFVHFYGGIGLIAGPPEGAGSQISYGVSLNPELGFRTKLRITRHYSIGTDLSYNLYSFKLRQVGAKTLPDTVMHSSERFLFSSMTLGIYNRLILGRVGNFVGKYIDVGIYGDWVHYTDHYFKDKTPEGMVYHTHVSGLGYIENLQYGLYLRIGITRYAFTAKYRISDYFTSSAQYQELPRFTFGFQVSIHRVNVDTGGRRKLGLNLTAE